MKRRSLALLLSVVVMMTSIGDTALAAGMGEQPDVSAQEIFSDEMQDSFVEEEISSDEDTETGITDIPEKDTAKKEEDNQGQESEELTVEDEKNTEDGEPEDGEPEDAKPADVEPAVTDMDEPELSVSDSEEAASPAADTDTPAVFEAGTQEEAEYETIEDQTLQDDLVISGNAVFAGTAIDLNGHTLTVEGNLWHTFLTFLLANSENAYSTACEVVGEVEGSVNKAALHDFQIFKELFEYDLKEMGKKIGTDSLELIEDYHPVSAKGHVFN